MNKYIHIFYTVLLLTAQTAQAADSQTTLQHSFSRSLAIGLGLLLLVQAGQLLVRRLSRVTRMARLQRVRRNRMH